MPEATNGPITIHYLDDAGNEPVLLIHGHTLDRRVWDPVVVPLAAAGLRAIRPDLRGHGLSTRPDAGYHPSHHAGDMAAVLDAAGVGRTTVVGYSVGGAVALEMALTMSDRVSTLVLVSPVMPDRPFEPEFMANLKEVARTIRADGVEAAMLGPWSDGPLFAHSFTKAGLREATEAITRDFPGAEYLASERDAVDRDWKVPDRLGEIIVPTAVVVGDHEMPGFRDWAREAADGIPGATLEVMADCGHLLPLEAPDRVAETVIEVMERTRPL
jgi:pimeloyl-ACP methyl ester carboxylesterase